MGEAGRPLDPGGRPQDGSTEAMPGEPFLRVIEGAAERKAAGGAQRKADPPPRPRSRPR
jgi:hypothetical protein